MYNGRIKPFALQHNQRRDACPVPAVLQAKQKGGTYVPPLIQLNK